MYKILKKTFERAEAEERQIKEHHGLQQRQSEDDGQDLDRLDVALLLHLLS